MRVSWQKHWFRLVYNRQDHTGIGSIKNRVYTDWKNWYWYEFELWPKDSMNKHAIYDHYWQQ